MSTNFNMPSSNIRIGKRSRSASTSSTSSTSSGSNDGSIFSQTQVAPSIDSSSSCSSPVANDSPPDVSANDAKRPHKTIRIDEQRDEECTLTNLKLDSTRHEAAQQPSPPSNVDGNCKSLFVDCLVDASVHVLDMIWRAPIQKSMTFLNNANSESIMSAKEMPQDCRCPIGSALAGGIPLNLFVRETLRRSRTSCSTLQAALMYCKRMGQTIVRQRAQCAGQTIEGMDPLQLDAKQCDLPSINQSNSKPKSLMCSRRAFLASIMISSKFLQDRTFSNRAWSKISGLSIQELGLIEREMLDVIGFDLNIDDHEWQSWTRYLKGEWKRNFSTCQCKQIDVQGESRKAVLERTTSAFHATPVDMQANPSSIAVGHVSDSSDDDDSRHQDVPMPFPMRKGFTVRSISAR